MSTNTTNTTNQLTTEELEQLLKERKDAERREKEEKRQAYELERNTIINSLATRAIKLNEEMAALKGEAFGQVEGFRTTMMEYGDIKNGDNNKGNFEIKNSNFKILFSSQVKKGFDERSKLAETKLKSFLNTFVKPRDKDMHDLVLSLLERDSKSGQLDISNIQRLYKLEERFDNPDWKEAIKLFKESYNAEDTTKYIRIYKRNDADGWDLVNLNFASI